MKIERSNTSSIINRITILQQEIDVLNKVAKSCGLDIHLDKCVASRFDRVLPPVGFNEQYLKNDTPVQFTELSKHLGVVIDTKLKFHDHIRSLALKATDLYVTIQDMCVSYVIELLYCVALKILLGPYTPAMPTLYSNSAQLCGIQGILLTLNYVNMFSKDGPET